MNSHARTSSRRFALSSILLLLVSALTASSQTAVAPAAKPLPTGVAAEYDIGGNEKHLFTVELNPDEFFQVRVEQKGVDLALTLRDGGGKDVARMNSPNEKQGWEILTFVAAARGVYLLEVRLSDAKQARGNYTLRREATRAATSKDRRRVEVEKLLAGGMSAREKAGRIAEAVRLLSEAEAGWRELGDSYMTEITARGIKQSKATAAFIEARQSLFAPVRTPDTFRAAVGKFQEARGLYREAGDSPREAAAMNGAAVAFYYLGELAAARDLYKEILSLYRALPNSRNLEADILGSISSLSLVMGDKNVAIEHLLLSLPILRELQRPKQESAAENDLGSTYYELGKFETALTHLNRALRLREADDDKCAIAVTLTNIGVVYSSMGEKARGHDYLAQRALPLYTEPGKCAPERAVTLINIGKVYYDLGEHGLALEYYQKALPLVAGKSDEAALRNNIGAAKYASGFHDEALTAYNQSLSLYTELAAVGRVATLLTNIGVVKTAQRKYEEALKSFREALELRVRAGDRNGEAITLNNIGETYSASGDKARALEYFNRALPLFSGVGDRSGEAVALANAMEVWLLSGNRRMAIFYGKQSVNNYQELRGAARPLDHEIQRNYLRTIGNSYRQLTEALIEEGEYEQAVQALNLYQDQQFFDFNFDAEAPVRRPSFSQREQAFAERYRTAGRNFGEAGTRLGDLRLRIGARPPTGEEEARLHGLRAEVAAAADAFSAVLKDAEREFARPPDARDKVTVEDVKEMRTTLGTLAARPGKKAATLYTLVGDNKFHVLLVTPAGGVEAFSHPVKATDFTGHVEKLLGLLRQPGPSAVGPAATLYDLIFKSMRRGGGRLDAELERHRPDVLLWSLNGALNYVPVAALYDAGKKQYVVEKYQNVVFTRSDKKRILSEPRAWMTGIGLGKAGASKIPCGKPGATLPGLPFVRQELSAIFLGGRGRPAMVGGRVLLDEEFNRKAMLDSLKGKNIPLVHISSHFCFQPGDAQNSFLLLGDDRPFPLYQMKEHRDLFAGVDLLVLSACHTAALQSDRETGREIDSLAELSQRMGANSVLATLWDSEDRGAGKLMLEFYRLRKLRPGLSKAEALRQAQLSLLKGRVSDPDTNLAHPSHWSAFVLYGGFQ